MYASRAMFHIWCIILDKITSDWLQNIQEYEHLILLVSKHHMPCFTSDAMIKTETGTSGTIDGMLLDNFSVSTLHKIYQVKKIHLLIVSPNR